MSELIKISATGLVSAKKLYLGLGLNKGEWSRWYPTNMEKNDFFKENIDWTRFVNTPNRGGKSETDFAISIEFAKHIAMMARTAKSHEYRNYFIKCEKAAKEIQYPKLSKELQAIFTIDEKQQKIENRIDNLESNMPLFNVECKELQSLVKKIGTKALGGYKSKAYNDNSLRGKVYSDIQHQLRREFGVGRYEAIKRCQIETAKKIVEEYKTPIVLADQISLANNQVEM